MKKYIIYENDMYVAEGTIRELARVMRMSEDGVYGNLYKTRQGKATKIEVYDVESDEE